ncbi:MULTISPECIES: DUF3500 domain-containing protein [unclassified Corynebacterium]|uniref:DUF3500 domain-containing protein n=1 Tax=unclassified Corynebacterium TaxID=2624378 RepID=UPI0034CEB477
MTSHRLRTKVAALLAATALTIPLAACSTGTGSANDATAASSSSASTSTASTTTSSSSSETTAATAQAVQEFLDTLSDEQKEAVQLSMDDDSRSTAWSNFPVTFVERNGLNLNDLNDEQRAAALKVLETLLSESAYERVVAIMEGDQYLLDNSSSTEDSLGQYYFTLYGTPSESGEWALQFGGHHLGLNATFSDGSITFAPTHFGAQPAVYTNDAGEEVQPMSNIYEAAFAFYDSLTDEQKEQLYQGEEVKNLSCAPGSTCDYDTGTGLKGADLNDEQKELLLELIAQWTTLSDESTNETTLSAIRDTLDETYINWSGATTYDMTQGEGIYFQISGPSAYIEFANQQGSAGADVDGVTTSGWGHIHTIYRDPQNDYAGTTTQQEGSGPGAEGGPGGGKDPTA